MSESVLRLTRTTYNSLVAHVVDEYPLEACGLLAGRDGGVLRLYPVSNLLASSVAYEMDPEQQLQAMLDFEERGWNLMAIYHSHPHGPDAPSPTDIAKAYYPDTVQIIVSLAEQTPKVQAYRIKQGIVSGVRLEIG